MSHVAEISFWSHNSPSSYYIMIYLSIPILLLLSISVFLNFIVYIKLGTLRCITETSTAPNENYFHFYLNCSFVSVFCLSCISVLRWNRISSNLRVLEVGGWSWCLFLLNQPIKQASWVALFPVLSLISWGAFYSSYLIHVLLSSSTQHHSTRSLLCIADFIAQ